jgi:serine/threonine-protein kinase
LGQVKVGDIILGKYEVTQVLGKGGMGLVVAARHCELDGFVALKFLLPAFLDDAEMSARFAREARTATRIKNEHVARVHDVGTFEGAPFIVMEHLIGTDLSGVLRQRGQLPIAEAVDLLLQACEAVAEAHAHGIVHRDLKPANLFVSTASDGTPLVKVLDFGISKAAFLEDDPSMTASRVAMGTPRYMSPEQLRSSKDVDARSDIWSLGVILYEMLAAAPPFTGESTPTVHQAILRGKYARLSVHRGDVPAALEELVSKALKLDRRKRPSSVEAFAGELAPLGSSEAQASYVRVQGITARASALSNRPPPLDDGGDEPRRTPQGGVGTLAESAASSVSSARSGSRGTGPAVTRSERQVEGPPVRWLRTLALLATVAAVAIGTLVFRPRAKPSQESAGTGSSAVPVIEAAIVPSPPSAGALALPSASASAVTSSAPASAGAEVHVPPRTILRPAAPAPAPVRHDTPDAAAAPSARPRTAEELFDGQH